VAYRIRELSPTAHAVIIPLTVILASPTALTPSQIDAPVVISSSVGKIPSWEFNEFCSFLANFYFGIVIILLL
jgi:hypothetical protein